MSQGFCRIVGFVTVLAAGVPSVGTAAEADPQMARLQADLIAVQKALAVAETRQAAADKAIAELTALARSTRDALASELAQPMLLLVGDGACPAGFKRVKTEVMLLSGPRTAVNSDLIDRAGLADDEQVGVGSRVYRYLDFCFRAANTVTVK